MTQAPAVNNQGYSGQLGLTDGHSDFNVLSFIIEQAIGRVCTMKLAEVTAVNTGTQTVDVRPLVNQIDGVGNATPHGLVLDIPYLTLQSGGNVVKMPPKVGDKGLVVVSDRDISAVKSNKAMSNPGSYRRYNLADGVYVGGILNGEPDQMVESSDDGITISDKFGNVITMAAGVVNITTASFQVNGNIISGSSGGVVSISDKNGNVIEMTAGGINVTTDAFRVNGAIISGFGTANQVTVQEHTHISAGPGSPTAPPTPGT